MRDLFPQLDRLDHQIIRLLQQDGRMSTAAIGRSIGVSETTVRKRIERLTSEKIIRIGATVEPVVLGYRAMAVIGLQVELSHMEEVARALAAMQEVRYVALSTGQYDVIIEVVLHNEQELLHFLMTRVAKVEHIKRSETSLTPHILKFSDQWWLPDEGQESGENQGAQAWIWDRLPRMQGGRTLPDEGVQE